MRSPVVTFVFLSIFPLLGSTESLIYMNGQRLLDYCSNYDSDSLDRGLCEGYITGVVDTVSSINYMGAARIDLCATSDTTAADLRKTFVQWTEKHPDELGNAASAVVITALSAEFPCRR